MYFTPVRTHLRVDAKEEVAAKWLECRQLSDSFNRACQEFDSISSDPEQADIVEGVETVILLHSSELIQNLKQMAERHHLYSRRTVLSDLEAVLQKLEVYKKKIAAYKKQHLESTMVPSSLRKSSQMEPSRLEDSQTVPSRLEDSQMVPSRVKDSQMEPSRVKDSQMVPNQLEDPRSADQQQQGAAHQVVPQEQAVSSTQLPNQGAVNGSQHPNGKQQPNEGAANGRLQPNEEAENGNKQPRGGAANSQELKSGAATTVVEDVGNSYDFIDPDDSVSQAHSQSSSSSSRYSRRASQLSVDIKLKKMKMQKEAEIRRRELELKRQQEERELELKRLQEESELQMMLLEEELLREQMAAEVASQEEDEAEPRGWNVTATPQDTGRYKKFISGEETADWSHQQYSQDDGRIPDASSGDPEVRKKTSRTLRWHSSVYHPNDFLSGRPNVYDPSSYADQPANKLDADVIHQERQAEHPRNQNSGVATTFNNHAVPSRISFNQIPIYKEEWSPRSINGPPFSSTPFAGPRPSYQDSNQRLDGSQDAANNTYPNGQDPTTLLHAGMLQTIQQLVIQQSLPPSEVKKFAGDPKDYPSFRYRFWEQVESKPLDETQKMNRLLQFLEGKARAAVDGYEGLGVGKLEKALSTLESKFGQKYMISNACISALTDIKHLNLTKKDDFRKYSQDARRVYETLTSISSLPLIDNPTTMKEVVHQLPIYNQRKWLSFARKTRDEKRREPTFHHLITFLEQVEREMFDPIYAIDAEKPKHQTKKPISRTLGPKVTTLLTQQSSRGQTSSQRPVPKFPPCPCCNQSHGLANCYSFKKKSYDDRVALIKEKRVCFKCFNPHHISKECRKNVTCDICGRRHATLLHKKEDSAKPDEAARRIEVAQCVTTNENICHQVGNDMGSGGQAYLQIVPVRVIGKDGKAIDVYALLDTASSTSFCTKELLEKLGINGIEEDLSLTTINQDTVQTKAVKAKLTVTALDSKNRVDIPEIWCFSKLNISRRCLATEEDIDKWPHLKRLKIMKIDADDISILIGANVPEAHLVSEYQVGPKNAPIGVHTMFGWTLFGKESTQRSQAETVNYISLDDQLQLFWKMESAGVAPETKRGMSVEDQRALKKIEDSCVFEDGHYVIGLPWKQDKPKLPNNKIMALNRLQSLKRKLQKDEAYKRKYVEQIQEYIHEGYATRVTEEELKDNSILVWYLPQHGVTNPMKPEKLRVVNDAAAKFLGTSLNDQLLQGPEMTNSLLGVLIRFRENAVAIKGDIKAMFHQVKVASQDRNALRFLWWENGDLEQEPIEYHMNVHIFGAASSPAAANYALRRTAMDHMDFSEEAREMVLKNFYVDDGLKAVASDEEAIELIQDVSKLLKMGGFRIHKWVTNSQKVAATIPEEDQAPAMVNLDLEDSAIERALGIQWNVKNDAFTFKIKLQNKPMTKRGILSATSSIFDPMGMVAPYIFIAKKIIQEAWRRGIDWDSSISPDLQEEWIRWTEELHLLEQIQIPRCVKHGFNNSNSLKYQLHIFSDGSSVGYGVIAFLRVEDTENGRVRCSFLMAKSRLAPVRAITIPRMELQAAVTAVRIQQMLQDELTLNIEKTTFWCDSTVVLKCIRNENKRFAVFVANRIGEIRNATEVSQWRYVNTELNPADEASKGMHAATFVRNERWFNGPAFLRQEESSWPTEPQELPESSEVSTFFINQDQGGLHGLDLVFSKISTWYKIKLCVAWMKRFVKFLRLNGEKRNRVKGPLQVDEIEAAEHKIHSYVQGIVFKGEISAIKDGRMVPKKSPLYRLRPVLDDDVLRVSGRLEFAPQKWESRQQIILPSSHVITKRIIEDADKKLHHSSGREYVLAKIRERYWPLQARRNVRKVLASCFLCRKVRSRPLTQRMADLPTSRLQTYSPPFTSTGVDCFGHFMVRQGRSQAKRWGCIFTCMTSRAVHIEVVESLDCPAFINALRRFISRRGKPELIRCDNGTNFTSGSKELKAAMAEWNERVDAHLKQQGIKWIFNTPLASHHGGVWERMIRSVRKVLLSLVGKHLLTDYQLQSVFAEAEYIINSRPLVPNSADPEDLECLTPNHLLLQRGQLSLPPGLFSEDNLYFKQQWKKVQYLADQFWQRWIKEYLPSLQEPKKWNAIRRNLSVGDIVLLEEKNVARGLWNLARVIEVFPGRDGLVRSAKIKTATSEYTRPISKMCLLELADYESDNKKNCET